MPQRPQDHPEAVLQHEIESYRRKLALQMAGRRLLVLLAIAAVPPLLFVVADHSHPAGLSRSTALLFARCWCWFLGLSCLALLVLTFRRRLNPLYAARALERASGIDHNSIVNAVLLQRQPRAAYASTAAAEQAAAELSEHWPMRMGESGAMRLPLTLITVVLAAWIGYALLASKPVWPSVARFFGASRPAPTATTLEQVRPRPGEAVHAGQELRLEFAARGGSIRQVTFEMLAADPDSGDHAMRYELKPVTEPAANWQLTLAPHEVNRDIHYRCTANDAVLTGTIPVLPVPMLTGLEIELEPPAYSGLPIQITANPDLEVLAGTRATFRAFANTVVENGTFVLTNGHETRTRMNVDPADPYRFTLSMVLVEGGQYRIEFHDRLGAAVKDPPAHQITLRPDEAPTVTIVEPAEADMPGGVVDVTRHAALVAVAEDDVRLAEFELVRADAGALARNILKMELEADGHRGRVRVPTADLPMKPGQQMRAWFEVRDGRTRSDGTPAPQTGRSREIILSRPAEAVRGRPSLPKRQTASAQPPPPEEATPDEHSASRPAGNEPAANQPTAGASGGQTGDQAGSAGPDAGKTGGTGAEATSSSPSNEGDFERDLQRFVEENGGMARDLGRRIPKPEPEAGPDGGESQNSGQTEPAGGASPEQTDQTPPAPSPASGQDEPAAQPPQSPRPEGTPPAPTAPPPQPDGSPSANRGQEKPGEDESNQAGGGSQQQPQAPDPAGGASPERAGQTPPAPSPASGQGEPAAQPPQFPQPDGSPSANRGQEEPGEDKSNQAGEGSQRQPQAGGDQPGQGSGQGAGDKDRPPSDSGSTQSGGGTGSGHADSPAGNGTVALPQAPQPPNWRSRTGPLQAEGLTETLDLLEWMDRGGEVEENMLVDLGWPADKAAAFITELRRLHEQYRRAGGLGELQALRVRLSLGDPNVQAGGGLSSAARTAVDLARPHEDHLRRIAPPPEQEVPAELRSLLDAYYRALAQRQGRGYVTDPANP